MTELTIPLPTLVVVDDDQWGEHLRSEGLKDRTFGSTALAARAFYKDGVVHAKASVWTGALMGRTGKLWLIYHEIGHWMLHRGLVGDAKVEYNHPDHGAHPFKAMWHALRHGFGVMSSTGLLRWRAAPKRLMNISPIILQHWKLTRMEGMT